VLVYFGDTLTLGRFRWVALQLDAASRCRSINALRQALSSLPRSLDDTYRRILESIEEQEQGHVRRILQWLCFSKRPLHLEEIGVIYEIADKIQPPFAHDDGLFHPEDIIGICRGLLSLHAEGGWQTWRYSSQNTIQIIQLAHFSVKEYLFSALSSPWTIDEHLSHVTILKSAIAYYLYFMTLRDSQSLSGPDLILEYSLAEYFSMYLPGHLTPIREHSDLLPSLRLLLHPPSTPIATKLGYTLLARCKPDYWDSKWYPHEPRVDELVARDPATNLCLAIQLRLPQLCQSLLAMNVQLDLVSPLYSHHRPVVGHPPLVEAVRYGEREILQVLLDAQARHHYDGLDPLADGSALEEAVKKHDTGVIRMLLDATDDIQETASRFGNSLPLAVSQGDKDLIIALLDAGADPANAKDEITVALISASRRGDVEMARILVRAGVDVDAQCGQALCEASYRNYEEIVHVLLEASAAVNMKHDVETALGVASRLGDTKIVKLLLDAGADVDAAGGWALCTASGRGHKEVVHYLLEAGAPVNMKRNGQMALQAASRWGHTKIVRMLIHAGADVDAGCGWALHVASSKGCEEIVRVLIEAGATVNMKHNGETALEVASYRGRAKIVRMLLAAGADVNVQCCQALHYACYWGYEETLHILLEAGADVAMKHNGETALEVASRRGHAKIVQMLLAADSEVRSGNCSRTQNYSYPSCMVDEDEDEDDYANDDSENSDGELEEGEGEREEDGEWEETEAEDDDERDDTDDVEEDNDS
jgi:ankyrin repeat protein